MNKTKVLFGFFLLVPVLIYGAGSGEQPKSESPESGLVSLVQGNVNISKDGKEFPANNWEVTLYSDESGRSAPVYTGSNGVYYFKNISPGSYILEVWFTEPFKYNTQLNDMMKVGRITPGDLKGLRIETSAPYTIYWWYDQFVKMERSVAIASGQSAVLPAVSIPNEYLASFQLKK